MWLYDDYSNEYWDPSQEKRLKPILTKAEARQADREYREEIFIRVLMQPYTCWERFFSPPRTPERTVSIEEWLQIQRREMKKHRRALEELQKGMR